MNIEHRADRTSTLVSVCWWRGAALGPAPTSWLSSSGRDSNLWKFINFLRTITFTEPTVQKISFVTSSRVRNSELPVNFSDYQFCNAIFKLISQTFQGIICYLLNSFQSPFSLSNFNKESCFLEEEMLKLCTWTSVKLV